MYAKSNGDVCRSQPALRAIASSAGCASLRTLAHAPPGSTPARVDTSARAARAAGLALRLAISEIERIILRDLVPILGAEGMHRHRMAAGLHLLAILLQRQRSLLPGCTRCANAAVVVRQAVHLGAEHHGFGIRPALRFAQRARDRSALPRRSRHEHRLHRLPDEVTGTEGTHDHRMDVVLAVRNERQAVCLEAHEAGARHGDARGRRDQEQKIPSRPLRCSRDREYARPSSRTDHRSSARRIGYHAPRPGKPRLARAHDGRGRRKSSYSPGDNAKTRRRAPGTPGLVEHRGSTRRPYRSAIGASGVGVLKQPQWRSGNRDRAQRERTVTALAPGSMPMPARRWNCGARTCRRPGRAWCRAR